VSNKRVNSTIHMPAVTNRAMVENEAIFLREGKWLPAGSGDGSFVLVPWMIVEVGIAFFARRPEAASEVAAV
jgi:hypothetical protein